MSSNRSAFKQGLREYVAKGKTAKASDSQAEEIIEKWRDVLECKQEVEECEWEAISASLFNMKLAMKSANIPQTDIDTVQSIIQSLKNTQTKLQGLFINEGSRLDELETLWGLEAGALE